MTPAQQDTIHAIVAIAIPVAIILIFAILDDINAKKVHKQNLKDMDDRYRMPKKY